MARHQEEKKKEEEAKAIALEAEKAAKEAPEMAAAESQRNAAEALTASQGAVSTESGSGRLNKAPEGNVLKGAESALKMEESRLQIYKEVVGKGFASEMDSNRTDEVMVAAAGGEHKLWVPQTIGVANGERSD
uniref:Uncharacterized protein n=1 Tax=Helianthus annuus TaxID=4232 RepID=A0A251V6J8_HELAN